MCTCALDRVCAATSQWCSACTCVRGHQCSAASPAENAASHDGDGGPEPDEPRPSPVGALGCPTCRGSETGHQTLWCQHFVMARAFLPLDVGKAHQSRDARRGSAPQSAMLELKVWVCWEASGKADTAPSSLETSCFVAQGSERRKSSSRHQQMAVSCPTSFGLQLSMRSP